MNIKIRLLNGSVHISSTEETMAMPWLTKHPTKDAFYFHPNYVTRDLFFRDLRPLKHKIDMDPNVLEYLKNLDFKFLRPNYDKMDTTKMIKGLVGISLESYQEEAVELMLQRRKLAIFLGPGTGKTFISAAYLQIRKPKKTLIITPSKVIDQFAKEIQPLLPNITITQKKIAHMVDKDNIIMITNLEQLSDEYLKYKWDTLILDESHNAKGFQNLSNKSVKVLSRETKEVYIMTGTPQDKTKFEIISQLSILSDQFINPMGKTLFLNRFFEVDDYGSPKDVYAHRLNELDHMISCASFGYTSEEVLVLPEIHHEVIRTKLESDLYKIVKKNRFVTTSLGDATIDTPASLRMKLKQIVGGLLILDNKEVARVKTSKEEALEKLVGTMDHGIIYTFFDEEQHIIAGILKRLGRTYVRVNGKISHNKAVSRIQEFKDSKVDFLVVQVKSGGTGLNLQRTNNIIFWSIPYSYIEYDQAIKRIWRRGQTRECFIYYLIVDKTFEEANLNTVTKEKKTFSLRAFELFIKKEI